MDFHNSWELKTYDRILAATLEQELGLSRIVAQLLVQRGINTTVDAQQFLCGELNDLSDPLNMSGMKAAIARIERAIDNNEQIVVYGDYDVDGVCSTVLLVECLQTLGAKPAYYVPNRFSEGYGLNAQAIESLFAEGCRLLISVDCGIASLEEVELAGCLGMDVIITDHHTPGDKLPAALAVINPKLDTNKDILDLAGVGVAFKLATALGRNKINTEQIYEWLELVALATVADIVPICGENRRLLRFGLERLTKTQRPGLRALFQETGLEGKEITPWHLGFVLGPRLNSAGRMESAQSSIELLLTKEPAKANELAATLCRLNNERRLIEEAIFQEAVLQVQNSIDLEKESALVLAADNWHHGVIGIVASRLCSKYQRPVILICWEGDTGRGSARSIPGVNIYEAISNCGAFLLQYGGHKMAAGLSINREQFEAFKKVLIDWIDENRDNDKLLVSQLIDAEIEADEINEDLLRELELLKPFGEGNPPPCLVLRDAEIARPMLVGKQQEHFKLIVQAGGFEGIAFNKPQLINLPLDICYHDLLFELGENEFRGRKSIQLKVRDMKCSFLPDRKMQTGFKNHNITAGLAKAVAELQNNKTVMMVFPNYRSLRIMRSSLERFFLPASLQALHGFMDLNQKTQASSELKQGVNKLFLLTEAFLRYFIKSHDLPTNLHYILEVWPGPFTDSLPRYAGERKIDKLYDVSKQLLWEKAEWNYDGLSRTIIYTNRSKTVNRLAQQVPGLIDASNIKDWQARKELGRRFQEAEAAVLLADCNWSEITGEFEPFDKLFFADLPLSTWEASCVMDQLASGSDYTAKVLFDSDEINFYKDYLARIYPNLESLKIILGFFKKLGKKLVRANIKELTSKLSEWSKREMEAIDLLPILYIMVDLGLCSFKKKGSIIEIMFQSMDKQLVDISNSSYYLEGVAERKAFSRLEVEINKYLVW